MGVGRRDKSTALYEETLAACQRALGPDDSLILEVAGVAATIRDGANQNRCSARALVQE
jgi:hypothetical protein